MMRLHVSLEANMKYILSASLMLVLMSSVYAALPGDSTAGKRLHDANCMACHDTGIYTRKDHAVQSLDALKQQLQGCSHMAQKHFSASETDDIIKYLNEHFYHFR
jgi:cytochrome c5